MDRASPFNELFQDTLRMCVKNGGGRWLGLQAAIFSDMSPVLTFTHPETGELSAIRVNPYAFDSLDLTKQIRDTITGPEKKNRRTLAWACEHTDRVNGGGGLCVTCYHKKYYREHPESRQPYDSSWLAKVRRRCSRKGITTALYLTMLWNQEGKCPCSKDLETSYIDHDHTCCPGRIACGKCVRGLLCNRCNLLLGMVESEPHLIPAYLVQYLAEIEQRKRSVL